jgi:hypothetical protein
MAVKSMSSGRAKDEALVFDTFEVADDSANSYFMNTFCMYA